MATSGTTNWNLDVDELCLDAWDMVGGQPILGYDGRLARRCLNLLLTEIQNRGISLWSIPSAPIVLPLVAAQKDYTLDPKYIDVIDGVIRFQGIDLSTERLSLDRYLQVPNKSMTGRPIQWVSNRQISGIILSFYFIPDTDNYDFVYWPFSKLDDVTAPTQTVDAPTRYLPALSAGLAYYLSLRRQGVPDNKKIMLKALYEEQLNWAMEEDRERTSQFIVPKIGRL